MAVEFIIEDGTGKTDSTSYETVEEFKQYWENRGVTFTELDEIIQTWLNLGTEYLDNHYRYWGDPTTPETQNLQWPRTGLRDDKKVIINGDVIPQQLKNALSLLAREARLNKDLSAKVNTGVASKRIGPVATTYKSGYTVDYKNVNTYLSRFIRKRAGIPVIT